MEVADPGVQAIATQIRLGASILALRSVFVDATGRGCDAAQLGHA